MFGNELTGVVFIKLLLLLLLDNVVVVLVIVPPIDIEAQSSILQSELVSISFALEVEVLPPS